MIDPVTSGAYGAMSVLSSGAFIYPWREDETLKEGIDDDRLSNLSSTVGAVSGTKNSGNGCDARIVARPCQIRYI